MCSYLIPVLHYDCQEYFEAGSSNQQSTRKIETLPETQGLKYICPNRGEETKQKLQISEDVVYECEKSARYQCSYCEFGSYRKSYVYAHVNIMHIGLDPTIIDLESNF